jgi:hypothetical protein
MEYATSFIAFVTDARVIIWTLAAFTWGGICGMRLERSMSQCEREFREASAVTPKRGWAADEEMVKAAREVA